MVFFDANAIHKRHVFGVILVVVGLFLGMSKEVLAIDKSVANPFATAQSREAELHEAETHLIRLHHLNHTQEIAKEHLASNHECRYASDIANPAPAKKVALSFDDGPDKEHTAFILSILEKHKVPASFFMIGEKMEKHPQLVEMVRASPWAMIAGHSWTHPNFHELTLEMQEQEIRKSVGAVEAVTDMKMFRYPYGNSSCESNQLLKSLNFRIVGWHVDSCDWAFDHSGTVTEAEGVSCGVLPEHRSDFLSHVLSTVRHRNGGILLMHEIHGNTLKHLESIITELKAEGYEFVSLTEPKFQAEMH